MKIIYILWLRQIKRHLRSRSRVIGSFGQPLLFLVSLGFGFGPIFERAGGGNYISFLAPGIVGMSILFTSVFSGIELIFDKKFGFMKETLVAPVSRFKLILGRVLGGATVGFMQGVIVLLLTLLIGFRPISLSGLPLALLFMFLIAILFTTLGTAIASFLDDIQGFHLIMNFLVMPIFFLSGALFPLGDLPRAIQIISFIDPLSYGVDGLRGALTGQVFFSYTTSVIVLTGVIAVITFIAVKAFERMEVN